MKHLRILYLLLSVIICPGRVYAQSDPPANLHFSQTNGYQLGIDDVLEVKLIKPIPIYSRMIVASDGSITFPYIGSVTVKGHTLDEVQSEIQKRLGEHMDYPVVSVNLLVARSQKFTVYGQVIRPGAYYLQANMSVLRAISMAGGLSIPGSTGVVKVLRHNKGGNGKSVVFDSDINELLNGASQDFALESDDTVVVTIGKFYIYGEVNRPGSYPVEENMSVLHAITLAGGFIQRGASGVVKIVRPQASSREINLDIKAILNGEEKGLMIKAGDTIEVTADKFYIYGQVLHPGAYPVSENMGIMYAITQAGGFIESGSMGRIKLFRANPQKGESPVIESDIKTILSSDEKSKVWVRPGDTIVVSLDRFFVTGQVTHPGAYPIAEHMSLLNAISTAGGFSAANGTVKLLHSDGKGQQVQELQTDFSAVLNGTAPFVPIHALDTIVVIANNFYVYGEVNHPGMYPLESRTTAMTAISIAGGFSKFGSASHVKVLRMNEQTGKYEAIKVNIKEALAGNSKDDVPLKPGDIVVVSEGLF